MKIYNLFLSLEVFILSLITVPAANAAGSSCQPIYGGGQNCVTVGNILINKKVLNPANNTFVDNLGTNDPKYNPGFVVNFRLEVTNPGTTTINSIEIKDTFPQHVDFSTGPGSFDSNTKTLTFSLNNLAPNETRTFGVVGKVVDANQLPNNQSIVCVANQAKATTNEGTMSQDNSQFCIQKAALTKGGLPVLPPPAIAVAPPTGPESLALFSLIPTAIAGFALRKYSKKEAKN